jgi:putative transposase
VPPAPPNALSAAEKTALLAELNRERFADQTPYEIYPRLLDEGRYLGSIRTMYRLLAAEGAVRDRRDQLRHPARPAPEVVATGPNQVWVWDITQLPTQLRQQCLYLYLVLDLFSRFIVGWLIAEKQSGDYATQLIADRCAHFQVQPAQLTIHSDNGSPMTAKPLTTLFSDLGIQQSLSRPHVSNDNPHAEAAFKTLKYQPTFPDRFASATAAHAWMRDFEHWYCHEHAHTALGLMTPAAIHFGQAEPLWHKRLAVLQAAYQAHPERFPNGSPLPPRWPKQVGINAPKTLELTPSVDTATDTKLSLPVSKTP